MGQKRSGLVPCTRYRSRDLRRARAHAYDSLTQTPRHFSRDHKLAKKTGFRRNLFLPVCAIAAQISNRIKRDAVAYFPPRRRSAQRTSLTTATRNRKPVKCRFDLFTEESEKYTVSLRNSKRVRPSLVNKRRSRRPIAVRSYPLQYPHHASKILER